MPLTTIKGSNIGAVLTNTQLNTTGTASSANVLPGTFAWSSSSRTGLTNYAASDPATPVAGDVWYQTGNVKVASNPNILVGIWSSGGALNSARQGGAGTGAQSAAMMFCGNNGLTTCERYNGATWRNSSATLTSRYYPSAFGSTNAALIFGGSSLSSSEEWDGISTSAGGTMSDTQQYSCGGGTLSAGISMAGEVGGGDGSTSSQEYNGTSWSAGGSLTQARECNYGCGTQTAALTWGGKEAPTNFLSSEEYDGTSWSAGGNTAAYFLCGNSQMGTQSAALSAGSELTPRSSVEEYNGTIWTVGSTLSTGRREGGSAGSQSAGLYAAGNNGSAAVTTCEEWNKPQTQYYDV